jgi:hypothetical protein
MKGGELGAHRHADWGVWLTIAVCLTITALSLAAVGWRLMGNGPIFPMGDGGKFTPATVAPAVTYQAEEVEP